MVSDCMLFGTKYWCLTEYWKEVCFFFISFNYFVTFYVGNIENKWEKICSLTKTNILQEHFIWNCLVQSIFMHKMSLPRSDLNSPKKLWQDLKSHVYRSCPSSLTEMGSLNISHKKCMYKPYKDFPQNRTTTILTLSDFSLGSVLLIHK